MMRRVCDIAFAVLAAWILSAVAAFAQDYPSKSIRIIVPYAAGGATDVLARLVAGKISMNIGQTVIVENRPGASGMLGADAVAKSSPDGYTILQNSSGHALAPAIFSTLPFDPIKDFTPVTEVVESQSVIVIYPKLPVTTLKDLVALAKAKPASLNYGVTGLGNASNLNMEMFKRAVGIEMLTVPYKGDAPLNNDLVAGQIHIAIVPLTTAIPLIEGGQLRALAVFGDSRSPVLPDVPTTAEAMPPGFGLVGWQGWFVPSKTPGAVVARIHAEVANALKAPEIVAGARRLGNEPVGSTPEEFGKKFLEDVAVYQKVVDEAKIPKLN